MLLTLMPTSKLNGIKLPASPAISILNDNPRKKEAWAFVDASPGTRPDVTANPPVAYVPTTPAFRFLLYSGTAYDAVGDYTTEKFQADALAWIQALSVASTGSPAK